jgi:hypothetical protein
MRWFDDHPVRKGVIAPMEDAYRWTMRRLLRRRRRGDRVIARTWQCLRAR